MRKVVYAGSFDPITRGHLDIIQQALAVWDHVVIAIGVNPTKKRFFPIAQSIDLILTACQEVGIHEEQITIDSFDGALVRYAERIDATALLRGLRQVSDFEGEFRLNGINAIVSEMPQVYMICHTRFLHVSSSTVKEMVNLDLDIESFVTPSVEAAFALKYGGGDTD
jgi:pantetheine-phosphate adenylyltransferase